MRDSAHPHGSTTSTTPSSTGRRLRGGLATAGLAAVLLTAMPVASASAAPSKLPPGSVMIQSAGFRGYELCASPDDQSVYLKPIDTHNRYCAWQQIASGPATVLQNVGKDQQVMAYTGGNQGAVVMEDAKTDDNGNTPNTELWSWGGEEGWGGFALQSFSDSGQNVDAKDPNKDAPRTDAVHTRGWRHGNQRELTWNAVPVR
ncbi:hypothetical protein ABZW30_29545 [Kitasatospora sp. NPDC004669]|uniref:hypothetical protein n=1 Tax=Kitasatospora sp. NPDC004669 TaxID=3154555 RepID=UPI0033A4628E